MRTIVIILSFLLALSCKKECNNQNSKDNSIKGKIKSLTYYYDDSVNNISRFYFNYDSKTSLLQSIDMHGKFQGIDTFIHGYIYIVRLNNDTILFYNNLERKQYLITTDGKQITSIYKIDSLSGTNELATSIYLKDNKVDSIYDIGLFIQTNISFYHFKYDSKNCKGYSSKWREFFGTYINKMDSVSFEYTSIINNNMIPNQLPCTDHGGGSVLYNIVYYLGIDGFCIIKPNLHLIDSAKYSDNSFTKYNYNYVGNLVSKTSIISTKEGVSTNSYQIYTYY